MPYVYILRCSDDTLYTGYTTDYERRLDEHQQGKASKYTRCRTPVKLVYLEELVSKSEAMKREIQIKNLSRQQKIILIKENNFHRP